MGPHKYRRHFFFESFHGRSNYIDLGLCITARPAPRTTRPLAGLPNPYPYGCSVLCNHPKDPELKDVVWKPRIPLTQDGGADHFESVKMLKRNNRTVSSSDVGRGIYHHNWEQKVVSNALGSYAEKDSAYPMTSSVNQLAIRRCASGGPSPVERRLPKSEGMLVLDLRPWKSFDNVSAITDGQHEPLDNFERFELKSPRTRMHDKPGRPTRAARRPETFLSKSFKEGKKIPKQLSKGGRGLRNSDSTVEDGAFTGHDANSLSDSMRDMDLGDGFPQPKVEGQPVLHESKLNEISDDNVEVQIPEVCEKSSEMKHHSLEDLEESLRNIQVQDDEDINQDILHQVEGTSIIEDMTWLYFPRAGNSFGARFEMPIDLRKLKTMTPIEYLAEHVVATRCRQRLNDVVFERHATESMLPCEKLFLSLTEILGFNLVPQSEQKLCNLIDLVSVSQLSRDQFAGIGALAERMSRSGVSRRDDLELADFNLLHQKMSYLEIGQCLRRLFMFICEIEID